MDRFLLINVSILSLLLTAPSMAHEGHDHGSDALTEDGPMALGSPIFLSKPTQFLMEVKTARVEEETLPRRHKALGRIELPVDRQAQVRAPFNGLIVHSDEIRPPAPGARVEAGAVLALLDQVIDAPQRVSLAADIANTKTALELAKEDMTHTGIELKRVQALGEAASERRLIETEAANAHAILQAEGLENTLNQLRAAESATTSNPALIALLSPLSGVVATSQVTPGEYVGPERLLFEIVDLTKVWAVADVYERDIALVEKAGNAVVVSKSYPESFSATLHHVSPRLDQENRTVKAVFTVDNPEHRLREGMFVTVHIEIGEKMTGLTIPKEAVVDRNGMSIAYVKTGAESFVAREVRVAGTFGDRYMIEEGLLLNEIVVTQGAYQVRAAAIATRAP